MNDASRVATVDDFLRPATLEEAVKRVVIPLRGRNPIAHAMRRSEFFNYFDERNPQGVMPSEEFMLRFNIFSAKEGNVTLVSREKDEETQHYYFDNYGDKVRYFNPTLGHELQGKNAYIVVTPSTQWSAEEIVVRMQFATQTAKDLGAERVTALFTEFPFARQDRGVNRYTRGNDVEAILKDKKKHFGQTEYVGIILRGLLVNGCDDIITIHHHSGHVQQIMADVVKYLRLDEAKHRLFNIDPTPLVAHFFRETNLFSPYEKEGYGKNLVFIAPDQSALPFAERMREQTLYINAELAYIEKTRIRPNDPTAMTAKLIPVNGSKGEYNGKTGIVLDDIVDTFGTMGNAIKELKEGINRMVMYTTHGIFSEQAEERMRDHPRISDVIVMETRPSRLADLGPEAKRKLTVIQPARYLAHAITCCIERNYDPTTCYEQLLKDRPSYFKNLRKIRTYDDF